MKLKPPVLVFAIPLLAACVSDEPAATADEKQAAMVDYQACLMRAAKKLDDGKSDARTVAIAIKPMCAGEFARTVKLGGSGLNPQARTMFEAKVQDRQVDFGTTAVLIERKGGSAN